MKAPLPRALGILPLLFFAAYLYAAVGEHRAAEALWMCHVSNVILGMGILAQQPALVRLADAMVNDTRDQLASALRELVANAVAQELARHKTLSPPG